MDTRELLDLTLFENLYQGQTSLQLALECVTHAVRPLRLLELADLVSYAQREDCGDMKRLIRHCPLVEVMPDETLRVQPEQKSHSRMALRCLHYITGNGQTEPFAAYALQYWFVHARKAVELNEDQAEVNQALEMLFDPRFLRKVTVFGPPEVQEPVRLAMELKLWDFAMHILRRKHETGLLPLAVEGGHEDTVRLLITLGADLNQANEQGNTPLLLAVRAPSPSMARLLISSGANAWDRDGCEPIKVVFEQGDEAMIAAFLPCISADSAAEALSWAVQSRSQSPRVIQYILQQPHFDVNVKACWGTPLYVACSMREPGRIKVLVEAGADPNILHLTTADNHGYNVLHALASRKPGYCEDGLDELAECFRLVLEAGANVSQKDYSGGTPLHSADNSVAVACLLDAGADPYVLDNAGRTALHQCHDERIIRLFSRAHINARSADGQTALMNLMFNNTSNKKGLLILRAGADITLQDNAGNSALHYAVRAWHEPGGCLVPLVKAMIQQGADVNCRNNEQETPLHHFKWFDCCSPELLTVLLERADLEAKDDQGRTPMMAFAGRYCDSERPQVLQFFDKMVAAGANLATTDNRGQTLLHAAVPYWYEESWLLQYLADQGVSGPDSKGDTLWHVLVPKTCEDRRNPTLYAQLERMADPRAPNARGETPLHLACMYRQEAFEVETLFSEGQTVFDYLMDAYDDVNCADLQGITPLHYASTFSELIVSRLLQKGADPCRATHEGLTALHLAARSRQANILGMLGSDAVDKKDELGRTALYYACRSGRVESVRVLLDAGATLTTRFEGSPWQGCADFEEELDKWPHRITKTGAISPRFRAIPPTDWDGRFAASCRLHTTERPVQVVRVKDEDPYEHLPLVRYSNEIVWQPVSERLDDIVGLLGDAHPDAITSAENRCLTYTVDVFKGTKRARARSLRDKMDAREFSGIDLDEESLAHLVRGGFAWLLDRAAATSLDHVLATDTDTQDSSITTETPLLVLACQRKEPNLEVIKVLIRKGVDINAQTRVTTSEVMLGNSALHALAQGKSWWQSRAIPYLVEHGANLEIKDSHGRTPLRLALETVGTPKFNRSAVEQLIKAGADPNSFDEDEVSCLEMAAKCPDMFELLIRHGAIVTWSDMAGALFAKDIKSLELMLPHGDPNAMGDEEPYLLEYAIRCLTFERDFDATVDMCKLLFKHGADPAAKYDQSTILHRIIAAKLKYFEGPQIPILPFVALFLDQVDMEAKDDDGCTILHLACRNRPETVSLLLDHGADVGAWAHGQLPLHMYLESSQPELSCLRRLITDVGVDAQGMSPLHLALKNGPCLEAAGILIDAGADVRLETRTGDTSLHLLLRSWKDGALALCRRFLAGGAAINARNHDGETPVFDLFRGCVDMEPWDFLDQSHVDWTATNLKGQSLLHVVAGNPHSPATRFQCLLDKGLEMTEDDGHRTPLDLAAAVGNQDILSLFSPSRH